MSPAVKKPKSRVSPPTSPSAPTQVLERPPVEPQDLTLFNQESIEQKLKEAEERKKIIETDRWEYVEASRPSSRIVPSCHPKWGTVLVKEALK